MQISMGNLSCTQVYYIKQHIKEFSYAFEMSNVQEKSSVLAIL